jgi:hypothetical protein
MAGDNPGSVYSRERSVSMPAVSGVHEDEDKDNRRQANRSGQHGPLERVTVNLTVRASRALDQAAQITGDSKTDTINRALQIYAYLEQVTDSGGAIYVRESPDGEPQLVKLF